MDITTLAQIFERSLDPGHRAEAEASLGQIARCPGLVCSLLQLIMAQDVAQPIRLAAAVYLKNNLGSYWRTEGYIGKQENPYVIPDSDKALLRAHIIDAIVYSVDVVRTQLLVCVSEILRHDFPSNWPEFEAKVKSFMVAMDKPDHVLGANLVLLQLTKMYRYKVQEERTPFTALMVVYMPVMLRQAATLVQDQSAFSSLLLKTIVKVFFMVCRHVLPVELVDRNNIHDWVGLVKTIVQAPLPQQAQQLDEDDRPSSPWWKCKKWSARCLLVFLERHGTPGRSSNAEFATYYNQHFTVHITQVMLGVLESYTRHEYLPERFLHTAIMYLDGCVQNTTAWKLVKDNFDHLLRQIVFPLMCHSTSDAELWLEDPAEYLRLKYDVYMEYTSPASAASLFVTSACKKRKGILQHTVNFIVSVLNLPPDNRTPQQRDGAMHMVGDLCSFLTKKTMYKSHVPDMLSQHILPEIQSPHGFLRARACWVVGCYVLALDSQLLLQKATELIVWAALNDKDTPVVVEALLTLDVILDNHETVIQVILPHMKVVVERLLNILSCTEHDDLPKLLITFMRRFPKDMTAVSVEVSTALINTLVTLIDTEDESEKYSATIASIFETLGEIASAVEDAEMRIQLDNLFANFMLHVFSKKKEDYYYDCFSTLEQLLCNSVSPKMREFFYYICTFLNDAQNITYLYDCVRSFSYLIGDADFLADPRLLDMVLAIARLALEESNKPLEAQQPGAKLMEIVVLRCGLSVAQVIPTCLEIAVHRLLEPIQDDMFKDLLMCVVFSALYVDPKTTVGLLQQVNLPTRPEPFLVSFLRDALAMQESLKGFHMRKLFVLAMSSCIKLLATTYPDLLGSFKDALVPKLCTTLQSLEKMYREGSDDGSDESDSVCSERYEDSGDEEEAPQRNQLSSPGTNEEEDDDDDDEDDDYDYDVGEYDDCLTAIDDEDQVDEFITFTDSLNGLQETNAPLYQALLSGLSETTFKDLTLISNAAQRRRALLDSRRLQQQGGFQFSVTSVPSGFDFGGKRF